MQDEVAAVPVSRAWPQPERRPLAQPFLLVLPERDRLRLGLALRRFCLRAGCPRVTPLPPRAPAGLVARPLPPVLIGAGRFGLRRANLLLVPAPKGADVSHPPDRRLL